MRVQDALRKQGIMYIAKADEKTCYETAFATLGAIHKTGRWTRKRGREGSSETDASAQETEHP